MANEFTIRNSLAIFNPTYNFKYQSQPQSFTPNQNTVNPQGPTPGSFLATTAGVACNLSGLTTQGGWAFIQNRDATNYITFGIKAGGTFYPLGELLAGESCILRLSRNILYGASGTALNDQFWFVANAANCVVNVEVFDP